MTCKVKETFDYNKGDGFIRAHTDLVLLQLLHQHLQRKGKKYRVRDEQACGFSRGCCRKRAQAGEEERGGPAVHTSPSILFAARRCAQVSVRRPGTHLQRSPAGPGGQEPSYEEVELCKRHGERRGMSPGLAGAGEGAGRGGGSPRGDCNSSPRSGRWRQGAAAAPAVALALARGRSRPGGFT